MRFSGNKAFHTSVFYFVFSVAILMFLCIILPYQDNSIMQWFRLIIGSIFVLFLPGLLLTEAFFDRQDIDILERIAMSFALSVSIVPL